MPTDSRANSGEPAYETQDPVLSSQHGSVAVISLNRPRYSNAQNGQLLYALDSALLRAVHDDTVKVILLRAEGKHFSGGHDIGTPGKDTWCRHEPRVSTWWDHSDKSGVEAMYVREQELYLGLCRRWRDIAKPLVGAVQGACIGGGLMLAWICDIIVASDDAIFRDPAMTMGVPGVEYFAHAFELPSRVARAFLMLGETMTAAQAFGYGMVNRVVARDALDLEAMVIAEELASRPRFAMALAKQALNLVDDLRHKRTAMDAVFALHHLAHAHNQMSAAPNSDSKPK
jgi:enoyl-CoA hydratase